MKILLGQNLFYHVYGGESICNRIWLEGLADRKHICRAVARSVGIQGVRTKTQFLDELKKRGISPERSSSKMDMFRHKGVAVYAATESSRLRQQLKTRIREFEPTWVLISSYDPGYLLLKETLRICPERVVYLAHTPQMFPFGPESFAPDQAVAESLRQTRAVVAVGKLTAEYIRQYSGIEPVVIHPPVYGAGPFPKYGRFEKGFIALINPSTVKGISIFLALAQKLPDYEFAALQGWAATQADKKAIEDLPNARLLKPVKNIDELFSGTRVLLTPSLYREGFGLTAVEAMLRGIPVLASDWGGLPEAKLGVDYVLPVHPITRYENRLDDRGWPVPIAPDQDIKPWLNALKNLLTDREHYKRLSHDSQKAAIEFVSGVGIEQFENFLKNLKPASSERREIARKEVLAQALEKDKNATSIGNLSSEKRALLARLSRKKRASISRKNETRKRMTIRFSQEDLKNFSDASSDKNPLHLSELYARKTPFGKPVLFGALAGLICLAQAEERQNLILSKIVMEFPEPIFVGIDYTLETIEVSPERVKSSLYDGKRILLKISAIYRAGKIDNPGKIDINCPLRTEPTDWRLSDLNLGMTIKGKYSPRLPFETFTERLGLDRPDLGKNRIALLMLCGYLVGMELPGCRALFNRLSLNFLDISDVQFSYTAKIKEINLEIDLVKLDVNFFSEKKIAAQGELQSFVRQDSPVVEIDDIQAKLPNSELLKGKVALVTGASRGLGAAIAATLASQGCAVAANFLKSDAGAERLKEIMSHAPGEIFLSQGDIGDLGFCKKIKHDIIDKYGRLDFLVCNAIPPLLPLPLEHGTAGRINEYVRQSFAMASMPMSVFLEMLSENSGWNVLISSAAVQIAPANWPHYVSAKYAIEGLARSAADGYKNIGSIIVRPPGLLTDLFNTPIERRNAISPVNVAAKLAERLCGAKNPGCVEIMDNFS